MDKEIELKILEISLMDFVLKKEEWVADYGKEMYFQMIGKIRSRIY